MDSGKVKRRAAGRDLTGFGGQWHIPDARPSDQVDKRGPVGGGSWPSAC